MPAFTGQLRSNEVFAALFNMIISQEVFADNIVDDDGSLVNYARVDGGLYGDTKLYYATDALRSRAWLGDLEATNLLMVNRPAAPECQAIELTVFRQIDITVDYYLSKRAWQSEGAFSDFTTVILGWIRNTKRVYDATTYNAFIGTEETNVGEQTIDVDLSNITAPATTADEESAARLRAQHIAKSIADLFVELKRPTRKYNDYEFLRSHALADLKIVWNSKYLNEITKLDLPTIFHKEGLMDKLSEDVLSYEYFGTRNTSSITISSSNVDTVRSLIEQDYIVGGNQYHAFAGEKFEIGAVLAAGTTYTIDSDIICKIIDKRSVPFMSAFEVGTSFFNPRSLTENHYMTWGHNALEHLKGRPFITMKEI